MFEVTVTSGAQADFRSLPVAIQVRVQSVLVRLANWPNVSGTKPLRRGLKGALRVRTGDYRVLFTVDDRAGRVTVFRIANRRDVYE
jgi:mRNA interferase RelE/StbE